MTYRTLNKCLACGSENLRPYFRAPDQPPANMLRPDGMPPVMPRYPLGLQVCVNCFHSQNLVAVDPEKLFSDYLYVSGTSHTLRDYFEQFVDRVEGDFMPRKLRVLDIAANDGSLLAAFKARGHEVLGVDPAENLTPISETAGVTVLPWFWEQIPEHKLGGKFDVIIMMNVLAHVANPALFLRLARLSLNPGGRIYVQTSQARMIERGEFDTVYHEHLSFFTARSLDALMGRCGLTLLGVERVPIHGTSYLATMAAGAPFSTEQSEIVTTERAAGYYDLALYDGFQQRAADVAARAGATIDIYLAKDYQIVGYGAAAKAITFLTFAGIELDVIVDDNPLKVGRHLPMLLTKIVDQWRGNSEPVLWVIGAWNMKDEIMGRVHDLRPGNHDAFLTWFPEVMVEDPEAFHE